MHTYVAKQNTNAFLRRAVPDGYSMQNPFIPPGVGEAVSDELEQAGYLWDLVELQPTKIFQEEDMTMARLLHFTLNRAICQIEGEVKNHIPLFSVRIFEPGEYGTTVHRNDEVIGPWVVGVTLKGEAPFNVYGQDQLPPYYTIPLKGDAADPTPRETMEASAGSAWTLYTKDQQVPHSSGFVNSDRQRELIIFYDTRAQAA
jgi:hypothetical protein